MSRESFLTALQESAGCRPEFASLRPPFHAFSTGAHPHIVGGMTKCALRSLSRRCMPSVNIPRCSQPKRASRLTRLSRVLERPLSPHNPAWRVARDVVAGTVEAICGIAMHVAAKQGRWRRARMTGSASAQETGACHGLESQPAQGRGETGFCQARSRIGRRRSCDAGEERCIMCSCIPCCLCRGGRCARRGWLDATRRGRGAARRRGMSRSSCSKRLSLSLSPPSARPPTRR